MLLRKHFYFAATEQSAISANRDEYIFGSLLAFLILFYYLINYDYRLCLNQCNQWFIGVLYNVIFLYFGCALFFAILPTL